MVFEAYYKQNPFATHLNVKCIPQLIQKYPVNFPTGMMFMFNQDLQDCVGELLNKDHSQRLGSDQCEMEILQHAYFY